MTYDLFVGIDIAATSAAVAWQQSATAQPGRLDIQQQPDDYARLAQRLADLAAPHRTLVVMEATGTYWQPLAFDFHQRGFIVSVVNPAQPRHFARLCLQRAKTDALDARLLAEFARRMQPQPWTPPPPIAEHLAHRLALREDFLACQLQQRNRLHALQHCPHADPALSQRLRQHHAFLQHQISQLTREIRSLLLSDPDWAIPARHLLSIPGIGILTAAWLLVATHAFTRCQSPEQAVAFAGLAPHACESGASRRGHRHVGGGHAALRRVLYMAAGVAARFNPILKPVYQRLLAHGKLKKVARIAVARKLVHLAWALVKHDCDFDPAFAHPRQIGQNAA
jgi:transposase